MTLYYAAPIDTRLHGEATKTAQIGFSVPGDRTDRSALRSRRSTAVFDPYRAPRLLLRDVFTYTSFLRVMEYATCQIVEDQVGERGRHIIDPGEASAIIVYGARNDPSPSDFGLLPSGNQRIPVTHDDPPLTVQEKGEMTAAGLACRSVIFPPGQ